MDERIYKIILFLLNSDDIKKDVSSLSLYDRYKLALYEGYSVLVELLSNELLKNNIKLISKEESEFIYHHLSFFDNKNIINHLLNP